MNLTPDNYFSSDAERHYMGSTQYKRFAQCETLGLAAVNGEYIEESSTALLVGSYVDAHFSAALDVFRAQHPEIFKRDGGLKADFAQANDIIARIEQDAAFMSALSGGSQVIMTGTIEDVPIKIKIDSLLPDRTVDLKIMRDMEDVWSTEEGRRVPFWQTWRYDIQAAIYQEIRAQNEGGVKKPFGLAVATKEKVADIALLEFPQHILDAALEEVKANIVGYNAIKKGLWEPTDCGDCPVCRSRKVLKGWSSIDGELPF